jgi:hypothetical protein
MPRLVLNASRIVFPDHLLTVLEAEYRDKDQLRQLRKELREYYHFKRTGGVIQAIAVTEDAPNLCWRRTDVAAKSDSRLVASLVLEAFLRMAHKWGRPSRRHDPVTIPGGKNILTELPNGPQLPAWIQVRSRFTVETRTLRSNSQHFAPFLVLDSRSTREISAPVSELVRVGFDPVGRYVQVELQNEDPWLAPRMELVGRVSRIEGGIIQLADAKGDYKTLSADEAFIEPRDELFDELLTLLLGRSASRTLEALDKSLSLSRQADAKLSRLRDILGKLAPSTRPFQLTPDFAVTFDSFLTQGDDYFPTPDSAPPTKFVFDVGRGKVDENNRRGIEAHGPFNCGNFTPTEPRIAVICDSQVKGLVESFLRKLKDGVPLPNVRSPFPHGFASMFRLKDVSFHIFETTGASTDEVKRVCMDIADRGQTGGGFDLVLLQNTEDGKRLRGSLNPYLVAKSLLLRAGIASQSFLVEKSRSRDYDLAYILADLALGCYAKLGGTPWLISADHAIEHEIILGVGSASLGESRFGGRERIVGITSVFKGDGDYLLSNLTKATPIKEYGAALTSSLRLCIDQVSKDMNWKTGDGVRIVVHAFKPMNNGEIDALQAVVEELTDYRVQFAFLHVKDKHPFSLFDEQEQGSLERQSGIYRGKYCPQKGTFLRISRDQTLACPWGAREVRHAEHGYPKPILLELHERSTFADHTYLARQVLNFASHSWRSFGPARMPVTILYSELVADILGKLRDVAGWSADILPTVLGKRRWFL